MSAHFKGLIYNISIYRKSQLYYFCYIFTIYFSVVGTRTSKPVAKLTRNGQPVTAKEVDIVMKDEKVIITFRKAIRGQTAKYGFSLTNSQGEATCELDLNIQGNL